MGTKIIAGLAQKLRFLAKQSQQKKDVETENEKTNFRVGKEYDTEQLTFERCNTQVFEKTLEGLEQKALRENLDEATLNYHCDCVKNEIERAVSTEIHLRQNKAEKLDVYTGIHNEDYIEEHYQSRSDYHTHQEQMKVDKRFNTLKKQQTQLGFIKDEIQLKQNIVDTHETPPLVRSFFNIKFVYVFVLSSFAMGDGILVFNSLQNLGEGVPNSFLLCLTLLIACAVCIGAHYTGDAMAKKGASKPFWAAFLISIFFVFILVALRIDGASMTLSLLNLAFFGIACLISYKRSLTSDYWSVCSRLKVLKNRKAHLENNLLFEQKAFEAETESVLLSVRHWVKEETTKDILHNKLKEKNLSKAIEGMTKILLGYHGRIEIIRKITLNKIALREARKKRNSFRVFDFGLTAQIRSLFASILVLFCLASCTNDVEQTNTVVLLDLTASGNAIPDSQAVLSHLSMDAGQVTLTAISDAHSYPYQTVVLPAPAPFLEAVKEEEDMRIANFEQRFKSAYDALPLPLEDVTQSLIFSALAQSFKALSKTKNGKHRLIIYSDLIEHEAGGVNFYAYASNPRILLTGYDEIMAAFRAEYDPEKQLFVKNLEVVIYYSPTKAADELWRFQQQFYTRFFKEFGAASIEYLPFYIAPDNTISQTN
ncbi:hypothetical protein [Aquimarina macrocephali]|uniref:hypothetical protein n=1 Tax=Aquimarina macrocephali TaxID=666563 RepID=UPI0004650080|nr:hypothetical protein [Aquimarina macrocephali]